MGDILVSTKKYAPNPTKAKELLSNSDSQRPIPEIVPNRGPKALSIYTYAPPDFGIAVASSDLDKAAGKIQIAAIRYATQIEDPVLAAAIPGKTKIPDPSIPAILIAITEDRESFLSSFFINFLLYAK